MNKNKYQSKRGKSNHLLWVELCELISKHPEDIRTLRVSPLCHLCACTHACVRARVCVCVSILPLLLFFDFFLCSVFMCACVCMCVCVCVRFLSQVEPIIRGGLRRYTDMIGSLWCSLATYHIRSGNLEKVRFLCLRVSVCVCLCVSVCVLSVSFPPLPPLSFFLSLSPSLPPSFSYAHVLTTQRTTPHAKTTNALHRCGTFTRRRWRPCPLCGTLAPSLRRTLSLRSRP